MKNYTFAKKTINNLSLIFVLLFTLSACVKDEKTVGEVPNNDVDPVTGNEEISQTNAPSLVGATVLNVVVNATVRVDIYSSIEKIKLTNEGGSAKTCEASPPLPDGLTVSEENNTCVISGTPTASQLSTPYTITGSNSVGSDTATVKIEVAAALPPSIANLADQSYESGVEITALSFVNTGGGSLSSTNGCTVTPSLPTSLTIAVDSSGDTCEIRGEPVSAVISTRYMVTATNATGNDTAYVTIEVIVVSNPPIIGDLIEQTLVLGVPMTTLTFTNTGGKALSSCASSPSLPNGLTIATANNNQTCQIIGTPSVEQQTSKTYTITAINASGNDTATVSIIINPAIPILANEIGELYHTVGSFDYIYNDTGTNTGTFSFVNSGGTSLTNCAVSPSLPTGLNVGIDNAKNTCEIIGTPTAASGLKEYEIIATNVTGTDSATVKISVSYSSCCGPTIENEIINLLSCTGLN